MKYEKLSGNKAQKIVNRLFCSFVNWFAVFLNRIITLTTKRGLCNTSLSQTFYFVILVKYSAVFLNRIPTISAKGGVGDGRGGGGVLGQFSNEIEVLLASSG